MVQWADQLRRGLPLLSSLHRELQTNPKREEAKYQLDKLCDDAYVAQRLDLPVDDLPTIPNLQFLALLAWLQPDSVLNIFIPPRQVGLGSQLRKESLWQQASKGKNLALVAILVSRKVELLHREIRTEQPTLQPDLPEIPDGRSINGRTTCGHGIHSKLWDSERHSQRSPKATV